MIVDPHFNGPPASGNGGVVSGMLAALLPDPVVQVTLRQPPPLGVEMTVTDGRLYDGSVLVAEAVPGTMSTEAPAFAGLDAIAAAPSALGPHSHPFPTCYVCGTGRTDGLGLVPGRVAEDLVGVVWTPATSDDVTVWAVLDCPGGWSADLPGRPMVLGRMTTRIDALPSVGGAYAVQGWLRGSEGRKVHTGSALYDADGTVLAVAEATWITLP